MQYIFKLFFLPFYLLKLVILVIATILIILAGVIAMFFGAEAEVFNSIIKNLWSEGIKYKGVRISSNPEQPIEYVFTIFLYAAIVAIGMLIPITQCS